MILRRQETSCFCPQTSARQTQTHLSPSLLTFPSLQLGRPAFHGGRSLCRRRQRQDSILRLAHSNQTAQTLEKDLLQRISLKKARRGSQIPLPFRLMSISLTKQTNQLWEKRMESSKAQRKSSKTCCDQDCYV